MDSPAKGREGENIMDKYAVIGGQYQAYFYGFADSLCAAKLLASKNDEYWDNWQGWHTPNVYRAKDVEEITNFYGDGYAPKPGTLPVAVKTGGKWATPGEI